VEKQMRTEVCRLIAGLVVADDDLTAAEEAFLDRVLRTFEIPDSEREAIFPIIDKDEAAATMRRLPQSAQHAALALLVEATAADGVVAPEERAYLDVVAREIGMSHAELDRAIAEQLTK